MNASTHAFSRRRLLGVGFAVAGAATAAGGGLAACLWARDEARRTEVVFGPGDLPASGAGPVLVSDHAAWIVNLPAGPDSGAPAAPPSPGGYLVLSRSCTCRPGYTGCTVPWLPDYEFQGKLGWFRCPCHTSVWSLSGTHVKGPATSLQTYPAWLDSRGRLHVDFTASSLAPANTLAVATRT